MTTFRVELLRSDGNIAPATLRCGDEDCAEVEHALKTLMASGTTVLARVVEVDEPDEPSDRWEHVERAVCAMSAVSSESLCMKRKKHPPDVAHARFVAMYVAHKSTSLTSQEVAEILGTTPSSVRHGRRKVANNPALLTRAEGILYHLGV